MKKRLTIIVCTLILNLVFVANIFATDVYGGGSHIYATKCYNWGWVSFKVHTGYVGNQYTGGGYQYVDGHDYIAFCNCGYPLEIPRGTANLVNVQLLNTSGTVVSSLNSGNFYSGYLRGWLLDPVNLTVFSMGYSYSWLQAPAGDYRIRVTTSYSNRACELSGVDSYYSSYF